MKKILVILCLFCCVSAIYGQRVLSPNYSYTILDLVRGVGVNNTVVQVYGPQGGPFKWDATNTDTADGGVTFAVAGVSTGRWVRQYDGDVNPRWFGAKANANYIDTSGGIYTYYEDSGLTIPAQDDTEPLVKYLAYCGKDQRKRRLVHIPSGNYLTSRTIYLFRGIDLRGEGFFEPNNVNGTRFVQVANGGFDVFRPIPTPTPGGTGRLFWYGNVQGISILGNPGNTIGSGIAFRDSAGTPVAPQDITILRDILVRGMPEYGGIFPGGSSTLNLYTWKCLSNGIAGIALTREGTPTHQAVNIISPSGDGNPNGVVYLDGLSNEGNITISNIKSETRINGITGDTTQLNIVVINNCNKTPITITGMTGFSSTRINDSTYFPPGDAIKITGSFYPDINVNGMALRTTTSDDTTNHPIPKAVNISGIESSVSNYIFSEGKAGMFGRNTSGGGNNSWIVGITSKELITPTFTEAYRSRLYINGTAPSWMLGETDGTLNSRRYFGARLNAGSTQFFTIDTTGKEWRHMYFVPSQEGTASSIITYAPNFWIDAVNPQLRIRDTSNLNNKQSFSIAQVGNNGSGNIQFRFNSNDFSQSTQLLTIRRDSTTLRSQGIETRGRLILNSAKSGMEDTLASNSATPDVLWSSYFKTQNTAPTTITNLSNSTAGQPVWITAKDTFTTFLHGSNFNLIGGADRKLKLNETICLIRTSTNWVEVGGGSGTINNGTQYRYPYYSATGSSNVLSQAPSLTPGKLVGVGANGLLTSLSIDTAALNDSLPLYIKNIGATAGGDSLAFLHNDTLKIARVRAGTNITITRQPDSSLTIASSAAGITSINSLTGSEQTIAINVTGTAPAVGSSGTTHTISIPEAGASATHGLVSNIGQTIAGDKTFSGTTTFAGINTTTSNLYIPSQTGVGSINTSAYIPTNQTYGGSNLAFRSALGAVSSQVTLTTNYSYASLIIPRSNPRTSTTGTHVMGFGMIINTPTLSTQSSGTWTYGGGLFIDGATTGATSGNYTLWAAGAGTSRFDGKLQFDATNTAGGTTGNQTINKPSGTVNIAAAGTSITVTNSMVTTNSIVYAVVLTNDATAYVKNVVCSSGSFVVTLGAAATAETKVGFIVYN